MTVNNTNYTYILQCRDGSYYTGWTNDIEKRVRCHQQGKGGHYTHAKRPVRLAYFEEFASKQEAMRRECEIKRLQRKEKEVLVHALDNKRICKRIKEINAMLIKMEEKEEE